MSGRTKGRGALVRRMRREYGLSEAQAREAADPMMWRLLCLRTGRLPTTADEAAECLRDAARMCPPRPLGWCDTPKWETSRIRRSGRTAGLLAAMAAMGMS